MLSQNKYLSRPLPPSLTICKGRGHCWVQGCNQESHQFLLYLHPSSGILHWLQMHENEGGLVSRGRYILHTDNILQSVFHSKNNLNWPSFLFNRETSQVCLDLLLLQTVQVWEDPYPAELWFRRHLQPCVWQHCGVPMPGVWRHLPRVCCWWASSGWQHRIFFLNWWWTSWPVAFIHPQPHPSKAA